MPAAGKLCQFPLADELQRAFHPAGVLAAERPLLLDPCEAGDVPEQRFIFDARGNIAAGPPVELPSDSELDPRAAATIRICNLNRRRLFKRRAKLVADVVRILRSLAKARAKDVPALVVEDLEAMLEEKIAEEAPFAGTARYISRHPEIFAPPA